MPRGILQAAVDGNIKVLVLLGADPWADFPDASLARRALEAVPTIVAVDAFLSDSTRRADVFLPCTLWGEKNGSVTNIEGRVQRVGRKVAPEGTAMDDWRIAVELAFRLGDEIDLATVDEVTDALAADAPAFAGVTSELLQRARDGVVLPMHEHADEIVLRTRDLTIMAEDGSGASWDPIKVEGEAADGAPEVPSPAPTPPSDAPALHSWKPEAPNADAPARDAYALRLVAGHTLYQAGRVVTDSPALQRIVRTNTLRINPTDAGRLGVAAGDEVKVTSARASQTVAVEPDAGVPAGVCRLDFTADGGGPALLIDASAPVTDLRVENLR